MPYTQTDFAENSIVRIYKRPDRDWGWMFTLFDNQIFAFEVGVFEQPKEFASWRFKTLEIAKQCFLSFDESKMLELYESLHGKQHNIHGQQITKSELTLLDLHINNFKRGYFYAA